MKKFRKKIKLIKKQALWSAMFIVVIILVVSGVKIARAEWYEPQAPPASETFFAPLTAGGENQVKEGNLLIDPIFNPDYSSSFTPPTHALEVYGTGALFSTPTAFTDKLIVDTDTLYADSVNEWVGIGTTTPVGVEKLFVNGGTVQVGTVSSPVSGRAISGYGQNELTSFGTVGTPGVATSDDTNTRTVNDVAIDASFMYLVGTTTANEWRIEKRQLLTGELVQTFGTNGVLTVASANYFPYALEIDTNYMYVVGRTATPDWRIEKRRLDTGALCTAAECGTQFGTNGVVAVDPNSHIAYGVTKDATYLYVVGNNLNGDWRIEKRRLDTGALCTAAACGTQFGTSGIATGATASNIAYGVAKDATYLYVVGNSSNATTDWRIEKRLLTTGALYWEFDSVGSPPGSNRYDGIIDGVTASNTARDIVVDSVNSRLYIVGNDDTNNWRIEKRNLPLGDLCTNTACGVAFDTDGVIDGPVASNMAFDLVTDANYLYVAGDSSTPDWRMEKHSLSDGALVATFGTGGTDGDGVITSAGTSNIAYGVAIDTKYMYVVGDNNGPDWRIEKRKLSDGSLDNLAYGTGFGVTGNAGTNGMAGIYAYRQATDGWAAYGLTDSPTNNGVRGYSPTGYGIQAISFNSNPYVAPVYGRNLMTGWAGYFAGNLGAGSDLVTHNFFPTAQNDSFMPFNSGTRVLDVEVSGEIGSPIRLAMTFDGTYIWTSNKKGEVVGDNNLMKVRASDGVVMAEYNLVGLVAPGQIYDLAYDGRYIWASMTGAGDDALVKFDPVIGQKVTACSTLGGQYGWGGNPQNIIVSTINGEVFIWTANTNGGDVTKFDRNCNQLGVYPLGDSGTGNYLNRMYGGYYITTGNIIFADGYIWVTIGLHDIGYTYYQFQIVKINPSTGSVEDRYILPSDIRGPRFTYDGRDFWVASGDQDPPLNPAYCAIKSTGRIDFTKNCDEAWSGEKDAFCQGAGGLNTPDAHCSERYERVFKIDGRTGQQIDVISLSRQGRGMTFDGANVWIAGAGGSSPLNQYGGSVLTGINAATLAMKDITNPLNNSGFGGILSNDYFTGELLFDGSNIWSLSNCDYSAGPSGDCAFDAGLGAKPHLRLMKIFAGIGFTPHLDVTQAVQLDSPSTQSGSINITGSAEVGTDVIVGDDVSVQNNLWGGICEDGITACTTNADCSVACYGGTVALDINDTANCDDGDFMSGVELDSNSELINILCWEL